VLLLCVMSNLSKNDQKIFIFIIEYQQNHNFSPTLKEIKSHFGFKSITSIQRSITSLEEKNYIKRDKFQQRNIKLVNQRIKTINIPLVGIVACGTPILAEENIEGYISTDSNFIKGNSKDYFYLHAQGDSMNKDGIDSGDLVLVHSQNEANNGDKVVALLGDSATIKTFKKSSDYIALIPNSTNPSHHPIILKEDFLLQGVVIKVVKN